MSYSKYESTFKQSTWYNPTADHLYAKIWVGPESQKEPWAYCEFPPGEETVLPSDFDDAIQCVDKYGTIQSGKVPQLVKAGTKYKLHPSLDAKAAERAQAFQEAQMALVNKAMMENAATLTAAKLHEVGERQKADREVDIAARKAIKERADSK